MIGDVLRHFNRLRLDHRVENWILRAGKLEHRSDVFLTMPPQVGDDLSGQRVRIDTQGPTRLERSDFG